MPTYKIVRFRQHGDNETIKDGISLKAVQAHCNRDDTKGDGWFDGYEVDSEVDDPAEATYRVEVRFDVVADSPELAQELAGDVASKIQADNVEITAIFDENWDEL
jgi:hypothetical protein